jgi:hypothetical protein
VSGVFDPGISTKGLGCQDGMVAASYLPVLADKIGSFSRKFVDSVLLVRYIQQQNWLSLDD